VRNLLAIATAFLFISGCAGPATWREYRDIAVEAPAGGLAAAGQPRAPLGHRNLMLCIVDEGGQAQCHHQAGVLHARAGKAGAASCAGADVQLRSPCAGSRDCLFPAVPLPPGGFGLLVVELRGQAFGVPRHVVVDSAVVTGRGPAVSVTDVAALSARLTALAECVAPASTAAPAVLPAARLQRAECEDGVCTLRRIRLRLTARSRPPGSPHPQT
jgi:hypothetical protein